MDLEDLVCDRTSERECCPGLPDLEQQLDTEDKETGGPLLCTKKRGGQETPSDCQEHKRCWSLCLDCTVKSF